VVAAEASAPLSAPCVSAIELEACRLRARQGAQRWLAAFGGAVDWLPLLAARLSRLGDLEGNLQRLVETEKLEAMAEFAAGAGHEINNPLTVISGRAQLFLQEETDPERRRALALISAQAMRVYEMIADMRLFARPPQPEPQRFDVASLVDGLVDELAPQAARQETTVSRQGHGGPLWIEADPAQLRVALGAVCQNALEALTYGGHIEIGLHADQHKLEITVADDGPGILPEERRHLFDPFYSARQAGRGLGLGLSKCWRIVTNHGGQIAVQSQPGRGATFTITLPLRQQASCRARS
jgi:signal transduction histidine kinase